MTDLQCYIACCDLLKKNIKILDIQDKKRQLFSDYNALYTASFNTPKDDFHKDKVKSILHIFAKGNKHGFSLAVTRMHLFSFNFTGLSERHP